MALSEQCFLKNEGLQHLLPFNNQERLTLILLGPLDLHMLTAFRLNNICMADVKPLLLLDASHQYTASSVPGAQNYFL